MIDQRKFGLDDLSRRLIAREKNILSSRRGWDIGVFGTIDHILSLHNQLKSNPDRAPFFWY